jgi:hypothetical protein
MTKRERGAYKLAIVGARTFNDVALFESTMKEYVLKHGLPSMVVSGGARGADELGERWANAQGIPTIILKPDWKKHGKAAGLLRNTDIVNACTHMIAFPSKTGKGTQDSIRKAKKQNIELLVIE